MDFLLYWSTIGQLAFVVVVFGGGSVAGLYIVRHLVPLDHLQKNHEVAGVTFGVLGAFYGLVLAFVIVAAWQRFCDANTGVHDEAIALETLYKIGTSLPEPVSTQLDNAVVEYTHHVVEVEWPKMSRKEYAAERSGAHALWSIVLSYRTSDSREQLLIDKAIDQLMAVSRNRSLRYLFYEDDLPSVIWMVIYLGCLITIGFSYFFGSNSFRAQVIMCGFFSILLGMTIVAILELAHPYQGTVVISDEPFRYALSRMDTWKEFKMAEQPHVSGGAVASVPSSALSGHPCAGTNNLASSGEQFGAVLTQR